MYVKLKTLVRLLIYLPALGSQNVLTVDIWLQQCSQRAQPTNWGVHSPSSLYRPVLMPANSDRVIRSPRLAAMGVATLSGLMPTFLDAMITPIIIRPGRKRRKDLSRERWNGGINTGDGVDPKQWRLDILCFWYLLFRGYISTIVMKWVLRAALYFQLQEQALAATHLSKYVSTWLIWQIFFF